MLPEKKRDNRGSIHIIGLQERVEVAHGQVMAHGDPHVGDGVPIPVEGADRGKIFYGENVILMDCGATFGESLGCLCLETGKEYYVS